MKMRKGSEARKTRETDIRVDLNLDGSGQCKVETGVPFFNHMMELFARHSLLDLTLVAKGDTEVDYHHTIEDVGLVLGKAVDRALGDRKGVRRYGVSYVTMDEALCRTVVDLGGRPYLVHRMACKKRRILDFDLSLMGEFLRAFVVQSRMNIHIDQLRGDEAHHAYEAVFKSLARALRAACEIDPRERSVPSSKGRI
jgi:imidazoleglycerol-phosphate dehydratase